MKVFAAHSTWDFSATQGQNPLCAAYRWDRKNHLINPEDLLNIQAASFHSQKKKNSLMINLRQLKGHQKAAPKANFNIFCSPKKASTGKWCFPLNVFPLK